MYNNGCRRRKDNLGTRDSMYNRCRRRKYDLGTRDSMYNRCRGRKDNLRTRDSFQCTTKGVGAEETMYNVQQV